MLKKWFYAILIIYQLYTIVPFHFNELFGINTNSNIGFVVTIVSFLLSISFGIYELTKHNKKIGFLLVFLPFVVIIHFFVFIFSLGPIWPI